MSVQAGNQSIPALAVRSEDEDRGRAKTVAVYRRRRQALLNVSIRLVSLIAVLLLWEFVGSSIDPTLFTTPSKVTVAAVQMIGDGELWNYLAPSLLVVVIGL
jgi:ABC-type nitrate/sulfonate/bicarbonate transport system permease component